MKKEKTTQKTNQSQLKIELYFTDLKTTKRKNASLFYSSSTFLHSSAWKFIAQRQIVVCGVCACVCGHGKKVTIQIYKVYSEVNSKRCFDLLYPFKCCAVNMNGLTEKWREGEREKLSGTTIEPKNVSLYT